MSRVRHEALTTLLGLAASVASFRMIVVGTTSKAPNLVPTFLMLSVLLAVFVVSTYLAIRSVCRLFWILLNSNRGR